MVRILLFAGIAERAAARDWTLEETPATVAELVAMLRSRHPFLASVPFVVAQNQAIARPESALCDGDEVALLPPVSGG